MRESEEKYRELVENLNDVIFTVNTDGIITYISSPVRQLTGYPPDELGGRAFAEVIHPDDLPGLDRRFREILENRLEPWEFRYRTKDGQIRWARTSSRPIPEGGRLVGIRGLFSDITERKRAEEQIRSQLEELQRWHDVMLGREDRVQELKREVNDLLARLGQPPRYPSAVEGGGP
ncbi:MAG: PAS domain S-box protein [Spirochaetes bacterium]|nr:PAS domain S-box protein [Spirochaetota bacterium]